MSNPLEITPYQNGVHSLAQGLSSLEAFIKDSTDPFLLKNVVMAIHHGIETLFKNLLFQQNPAFLLAEKSTVKDLLIYYEEFINEKNQYFVDEAKTVSAIEAVERARKLGLLKALNEREYSNMLASLKNLNTVRNQLQHFAVSAYAEPLIRILGNLIPKAVKAINYYYEEQRRTSMHFGLNRIYTLPHTLPLQFSHHAGQSQTIESDLNKLFDRSTTVIEMLESKYDVLLNAAIQRFKDALFEDLPLRIHIRDHGNIGASPYMPEIELQGWLNSKFSPHENSRSGRLLFMKENIIALYEANTIVHDPIVIKEPKDNNDQCISKLSIEISTTIDVLVLDSFFQVPGANDDIQFIRSPEIIIKIIIDCIGEGLFNEFHYDITRVHSISGEVVCELESSVFGDDDKAPSVRARQTFSLNQNNTSLSFHAFVESNKKLRKHHSLEINIDSKANVQFE